MNYQEYLEVRNLIEAYVKTGSQRTLAEIQNSIATKKGLRQKIYEDLEHNGEFIQVFSRDDQIKILSDLTSQIKQREHNAYIVSRMLPYLSNEVLNEILANADDVALTKIMEEIQSHIRVIGNRFCDSSTYFWLKSTNIFSRMGERITWWILYRKCKKNLKR